MCTRCVKLPVLFSECRLILGRSYCRSLTNKAKSEKSTATASEISTSFVKNIFLGKGVFNHVVPYPVDLSDEKREMIHLILGPTKKFMEEFNNPAENDEKEEVPIDILSKLAEIGALGALVPEEYDGAGLNNTQFARVAEVIGESDLSLAVVMGAHQSIGYKGILLYGTDEQKRKYLPDLATGRKFAAFCLTESGTGSDANSVQTHAEKSSDGRCYVLNGGKLWISNGSFADIFTVFARTQVKDKDGTSKSKMSAFIVERSHGGITTSIPEKKMGIKGSKTVEVHFDNTKVPVDNLLGAEGEGFKLAMNILNNGRFGIPAVCTGSMKFCIQKTIEHISERGQFGRKLKEFGNVQEQLTDMVLRHYATESLLYMLSGLMDKGTVDYELEAALAKIMASENAWIVCDRAIQLHGGMGYMKECGLERVMRDLRIFRIFEGANDVLRLFVALTGLQYAGKHMQYKMKKPWTGSIGLLFESIFPRSFDFQCHPSLNHSVARLKKTVHRFGNISRFLLWKHKRAIIERQWELIRMADAAIDIYSVVAVLSRCNRAANQQSSFEYERKLAELYTLRACEHVRILLDDISKRTGDADRIKAVSDDILKKGSLPSSHPTDY
ncbi:Acyl-CoA dehydrogenase, C-terminal domain containing protein [Brugia malayi]|uniref:Very long-chain specific acyl-CoA dehydrogenase, mitochondrial n=1 Tax=Brugia malayi TaxID=6279 RepID=A0A4E9FBV0_BRUMA|nr:Acyl-CoA dehydrogenase, C-terminal domain containing protein [Brugia malayi]VIO93528.1 Acyl-CoA dehydrogenase, C-terminal domain containing protein [Brugia malayi]